jgi:signal transduction histidine kinase
MPRSLRGQLVLTYVVVVLLGLGSLIAWAGQRLQAATISQAERELELQAHLLADALRDPLEGQRDARRSAGTPLPMLLENVARTSGSRVTIVDPRLRTIISSDPQQAGTSQVTAPELLAARDGRPAHDIRRDAGGEERLFVAAPIAEEHRGALGFLQLAKPMGPVYAQIGQLWLSLLAAGGAILLLTVLVSLALARRLARPILQLTQVSERLAHGSLDERARPDGPEEIRHLGQTFNHMAERLQDMLQRQQAFVAHAAHEFRSPLASVRLRLEILQRPDTQDDRPLMQRYLGQMEREVDQLRQLVDHLLALVSLDEGQQPPRVAVDLAPLLYEVADEVGPVARATGVDLRVDVPPHLPVVQGSPEQLRVVARNLLDNAIKYSPAGGPVTLTAQADNHAVQVEVQDHGIGITAEALPHIFERFYRADPVRSRAQGGAGLGLALVRAIAVAHGGCVSVESTPGAGSTFRVRLPIATQRPGGAVVDSTAETGHVASRPTAAG